jgi:peptidoglycan hydrolase-like protein with peptidoglycan-binding domain
MSWADFTGKPYSRDELVNRLNSLEWNGDFTPVGIILHNTAAPTLKQWVETGPQHDSRIENLKDYYKGLGWHAGPHWFVSRNWINEFMKPTTRGTHSPSFNKDHFGIEMVGDYDKEAFNSGDGALVRDNAVFLMAYLCNRFGWDPGKVIKLHKEDPKTDHDCPGRNVSKADVIARVKAQMQGVMLADDQVGPAKMWRAPASMRAKMARAIANYEARRDSQGHLSVYQLPSGDQGGTYEVAGFNDKYHPKEAAELKALIDRGQYDQAEEKVAEYLLRDTAPAAEWVDDPGIEFFLRDSIHHRGVTGAAKILQGAVGVKQDGDVGPDTKAAIATFTPQTLLTKLRAAREEYELDTFGKRDKFWKGFLNRWNNSMTQAKEFMDEVRERREFVGELQDKEAEEAGRAYSNGSPMPSLNEDVRLAQRLLGFSAEEQDGIFGELTEKAVIWFQRRNRLKEIDGVVGEETWIALEGSRKS